MAEINLSCGIGAHRKKVEENSVVYDDNLAEYFARLNHTNPRPKIYVNSGEN